MEFLLTKKDWNKSGVYIITNGVNGKVYVGRTKNFRRRYDQYKYSFKTGKIKHINEHFLNSMNKYGFENFTFQHVIFCTVEESLELEVLYIYLFESFNKIKGYNKRIDAEGGMAVSEETSEKISKRLKKEWKEGIRENHGEKLKESWDKGDRSKKEQSERMSKTLTKYYYIVNDDFSKKLTYKDLQEKGYKNAISSFHGKKSNRVNYKSVTIERFLIKKDLTSKEK